MFRRLYFPLVVLFWVAMNVLLWRSEMRHGGEGGGPVPTEVIWDRILTAPDDSSLQVVYQGKRLGYCRWAANVGEAVATGKRAREDEELEGRVRRPSGYTLDFDGNLLIGEPPQRWRFNWHAECGTNQVWRKLQLRLFSRPNVWEVQADAEAETVRFRWDDQTTPWEKTFTFAELRRPGTLLASLGIPLELGWLEQLARESSADGPRDYSLGLRWEGRNDWLEVGHSSLRVFRLQTKLLDKYHVVVYVSRVGEILRVELPNQVVLANEALLGL